MATVPDMKMNVSFWVDDKHTQSWRIRAVIRFARLLGITLVNTDQEFAAR